ncbi:MAG: hypothetical protein DME57_00075 [Verrucomicrobia bacterium]|nr:MAG: hypothetical protein DME57_00075 [Verrucomicrobiota bacterium]
MIENPERIARELRLLLKKRRRTSPATIERALAPLATFAVTKLQSRAPPPAKRMIAASAWGSLAQDLNKRLLFALGPTLRIEQIASRALARGSNKRTGFSLNEATRTFPGLLETAAQIVSAWIHAQKELIVRLKRDRALLRKHFAPDRRALRVIAIRPSLSDPHDCGRTVTRVGFSPKRRVIYKPRRCDGEKLWFAALRWLNRNGVDSRFKIPTLLARKNYHWMEFLRRTDCRSSSAVRSFYFRWGAQVALAQILGASDLHRENWLAVGMQPILLDAELIGSKESRGRRTRSKDRQRLSFLLQTGLVPLTARDRAGFYEGIAPLDATLARTDRVSCWPTYNGIPQSPVHYINELVRGFETVAAIFANRKSARKFYKQIISAARWPRETRTLFRPSAEYARILVESLMSDRMTSRNKRRRWLAQKCSASAATRAVAVAEACALFRCDIPKFSERHRRGPISSKEFSAAIAQLKSASRVLGRRVCLGAPERKT